ncbi:MAG TPA: DNA mismatch repair endonuclease MutL [Opitutaceae bacterium]|nr:DNA mismatch repair endonuclease MutL [Opitutaceae bacterium]
MATIHILPDKVANQIAAGEVVERPAAVVKELVENSLDAGATRITVEFAHGGRSLMRVEDDGRGMDREDAQLALQRHATSKIAVASDLDRLGTFGFRGEALPSIASVSKFELRTRRAEVDTGIEIAIHGGRTVHVKDCGMPAGTRITVSQLFGPVPARRKFLKSDTTESAHIIQCVRFYALAHPGVAFTLIEDGRVIFQSPACEALLERVTEIFGKQIAASLMPVEAIGEGVALRGFIGRPGASRSTRHDLITFVNRRPVDSRTLTYAVIESYQASLPRGRYPLAFLFLEIDPTQVDVNVHPAKREVRFRHDPTVRSFVITALLEALRGGAEPKPEPVAPQPVEVRPAIVLPQPMPQAARTAQAGQPAAAGGPPLVRSPTIGAAPPPPAPEAAPVPAGLAGWRFISEIEAGYWVYESPNGLVILDERASLERILFEKLEREFAEGRTESQRMLFAVPVELDPVAAALLGDHLVFLAAHGLEVAAFGRNFFRIEAVPAWLDPADAEPFLRDILGSLREGRLDPAKPAVARENIARLAAARAIAARRSVGREEPAELIAMLLGCERPLLTPSGRPTYIEISGAELAQRFQKENC